MQMFVAEEVGKRRFVCEWAFPIPMGVTALVVIDLLFLGYPNAAIAGAIIGASSYLALFMLLVASELYFRSHILADLLSGWEENRRARDDEFQGELFEVLDPR